MMPIGEDALRIVCNENIYRVFKEILVNTSNKDIFKLAIVLTSQVESCEELLDIYTIIGQYGEFIDYLTDGFVKWIDKTSFKETSLKLLDLSRDWNSFYLVSLLLKQEDIVESMDTQRRLIIGNLNKNSMNIIVILILAKKTNIKKLLEMSREDEILFKCMVKLFNALFTDNISHTWLYETIEKDTSFIDRYLDCLEDVKFEAWKFVAIRGVREFINLKTTKKYIASISQEAFYNSLQERVEKIWDVYYKKDRKAFEKDFLKIQGDQVKIVPYKKHK